MFVIDIGPDACVVLSGLVMDNLCAWSGRRASLVSVSMDPGKRRGSGWLSSAINHGYRHDEWSKPSSTSAAHTIQTQHGTHQPAKIQGQLLWLAEPQPQQGAGYPVSEHKGGCFEPLRRRFADVVLRKTSSRSGKKLEAIVLANMLLYR